MAHLKVKEIRLCYEKCCISTNFEWPTFAYMSILNTRARILCNRNEKIINQKFVLLKVASDKKFGVKIHTHIYREPGQIRRLSYRLQYFFISDSVKLKLCNNRLHNATVCFYRYLYVNKQFDRSYCLMLHLFDDL
jgi:hypothetical protein